MFLDRGESFHEEQPSEIRVPGVVGENTPSKPTTDAEARRELKSRNFILSEEERSVLEKMGGRKTIPKDFTAEERRILFSLPRGAEMLLLSREERHARRTEARRKKNNKFDSATTTAFEKSKIDPTGGSMTPEEKSIIGSTSTKTSGIDWFLDDGLPGTEWVFDESDEQHAQRVEQRRPENPPMDAAAKSEAYKESQEVKKEMVVTFFERAMDNGLLAVAFDKLSEIHSYDEIPESVRGGLREQFIRKLDEIIEAGEGAVGDKIRAQIYRNELIAMRDTVANANFGADVRVTARFLTPEESAIHSKESEQRFEKALQTQNLDDALSALEDAKAYGSAEYLDMHDELVWDIEVKLQKEDKELGAEERTRIEQLLDRAKKL